MNSENQIADRIASFVIGVSVVGAIIALFFDWRFSALAMLVVWNQIVLKKALRKEKTGIRAWLSLGAILIFVWHFFI